MYNASDLKKGLKIQIDGEPYVIVDFQFSKPGKGQALYRCKIKNLTTGATVDKTYRSVDKIDRPNLREKEMIYSYLDGEQIISCSLDVEGLGIRDGDLAELLDVEADGWLGEIPGMRAHYARFGDRLPRDLARELEDLEKRLQRAGSAPRG